MKSLFVLAAVAVSIPFATGCAAEEEEMQVEYPQPVGYTPPPGAAAAQGPTLQTVDSAALAPQGAQAAPAAATGEQIVVGADADGYEDTDPAALTDFRSTLDPYGTWREDPTYGTVWAPSPSVVGSDFTPYMTAGHWVYDDDYVWVSDYDWGWAPFHYGRWVYVAGYGWEWIPGRVYAGAWVSWRYGWDDWAYVGWAPLPPVWYWRGGYAVGLGFVPVAPYAFVGSGDVFAPAVATRVIVGAQAGVVASHTRPFVPAQPTVNGRVPATPRVGGPPPQVLHIAPSAIVRAPASNRGLMQARAYSRPSTAASLGARVPQSYGSRTWTAPSAWSRAPSAGSALARPMPRGFNSGWSHGPVPYTPPSYGGARPSYGSPPAFHGYSGGSASAPSYHPPSGSFGGYRGGTGYFHGGGGGSSAPSGGSFRSGGSSGVSHGGGFSGGFHGGGGGFHGGGGGFHGGGGGRGGHR